MATRVPMPEAAVNKNYLPAGDENEVGLPRERLGVQCIAIAHGVNQLPDTHLRRGVLAADRTHARASLFRG